MRPRALVLALAVLLAAAPAARSSAAPGPHQGPVEWLPPTDPLVRDVEWLRASGLADTAVTATTFPANCDSVTRFPVWSISVKSGTV